MTSINIASQDQEKVSARDIRNDTIIRNLMTRTPQEIITYLQSVTDPEERWDITMRAILIAAHLIKKT